MNPPGAQCDQRSSKWDVVTEALENSTHDGGMFKWLFGTMHHICWFQARLPPPTQLINKDLLLKPCQCLMYFFNFNFVVSPTVQRMCFCRCNVWGHSGAAVQQVVRYLWEMCPSRGEGGFVLSSRPPLSLCASNKLSSGSNEARNCKLSGEAQCRDKGLVFAGNVHGAESDTAESHARMGVMIPPLLWRVMFNPLSQCIHLQIFLSPLICINIPHTLFNTDLSDSIFPLVLTIVSLLLKNHRYFTQKRLNVLKQQTFAGFSVILMTVCSHGTWTTRI